MDNILSFLNNVVEIFTSLISFFTNFKKGTFNELSDDIIEIKGNFTEVTDDFKEIKNDFSDIWYNFRSNNVKGYFNNISSVKSLEIIGEIIESNQ
jgi:hypothetical protein